MSDEQVEIRSTLGIDDGRSAGWKRPTFALVLAVLAGTFLYLLMPNGEADGDEYRTARLVRGGLTVAINATGSVEPTSVVEISSELSGTIAEVFADFNDVVSAGEVLARLDTSKLEAQAEVQRANLRSAEARLARAVVNLDEAQVNAERARALGSRGVGSEQSVTSADAALARAVAELDIAEADVAVAKANLQLAETDLGNACICSPVDGIVLDRAINPGRTISVATSAPALFAIAEDLTEMELQLAVDEADIARLQAGQHATFEVDAHEDRQFSATVRQIRFAPETIDGVVTYTVILEIENDDLALRPGMTAVADIVVNTVPDALLVPNAALRFVPRVDVDPAADDESGGGLLSILLPRPPSRSSAQRSLSTVWVLRDGEALEIEIVSGDSDGRLTEVRGGLQEGDVVIVGQDADVAPLIRLRQATRVYGSGAAEVRALDGVDIDISAGEFVAIMGPSGSGKSTAMNVIGCLDRPTSGQYLFSDVEVGGLSIDQRALLRRHYLGFIFQGYNLLPRMSARDNVELPLIYKGLQRQERVARAERALDLVGLGDRAGHDPSQLSGGQQQRVAIARALAGNPRVVLADEPTGNLDTTRSAEIMELLVELRRDQKLTIIMVTHEEDMAAYADRLIWMVDGRVQRDNPSQKVA